MTALCLDEDLLGVEAGLRAWEPGGVAVVLGRTNRADREVFSGACRRDGVPVLRRRGGGGAVVLAPGSVVVSLHRPARRPLVLEPYRDAVVRAVRDAVAGISGLPVSLGGSGDLCLGDRKILGSSFYRRRRSFFYQGSLLVDLDLGLVERYLRHPSREPAYRAGRPHRAFLTTLRGAGCPLSAAQWATRLREALRPALAEWTEGEAR